MNIHYEIHKLTVSLGWFFFVSFDKILFRSSGASRWGLAIISFSMNLSFFFTCIKVQRIPNSMCKSDTSPKLLECLRFLSISTWIFTDVVTDFTEQTWAGKQVNVFKSYLPVVEHRQSKGLTLCVRAKVCLKAERVDGWDESLNCVERRAWNWCILGDVTPD